MIAIALAVAAVCDGQFHYVETPGAVCLDGSHTGFEYVCQKGLTPEGPLLVEVDGGGACWDADTCDCQPDASGVCQGPNTTLYGLAFFGIAQSLDGRAWSDTWGAGPSSIYAGPTSPFDRNYNFVHIPYCSADTHSGDAIHDFVTSGGRRYQAWFKGYPNFTLFMRRAQALFPAPRELALHGGSAGGLGVECNMSQVRATWPDRKST